MRKSARVASIPKRRYREGDGGSEKERKKEHNNDDGYSDESESDADFYSDDSQVPSRPSKRKRGGYKYARDYGDVVLPGDADGLRRRVVNGRNVQHIDPKKRNARPDPKVFGPIRGIKVGQWWPSRLACSADAVHPVCLRLPTLILATTRPLTRPQAYCRWYLRQCFNWSILCRRLWRVRG